MQSPAANGARAKRPRPSIDECLTSTSANSEFVMFNLERHVRALAECLTRQWRTGGKSRDRETRPAGPVRQRSPQGHSTRMGHRLPIVDPQNDRPAAQRATGSPPLFWRRLIAPSLGRAARISGGWLSLGHLQTRTIFGNKRLHQPLRDESILIQILLRVHPSLEYGHGTAICKGPYTYNNSARNEVVCDQQCDLEGL